MSICIQYIVFADDAAKGGLVEDGKLMGSTYEDVVKAVTDGVGNYRPNQRLMYYIYEIHSSGVCLFGSRFDVYKLKKMIAGSEFKGNLKQGLGWAFTNCQGQAPDWCFTDVMWR